MADTITVGSKAHAALRISEPLPAEFKDKPGEAPALRTAVLNGSNHPDAKFGMGITHGVDAELFHAWLDAEKKSNTPLAGLIFEVSDEEAEGSPMLFGHEPGLDALAADGDNVAAAAKGSTMKDAGPVSADDMKPTAAIPEALAQVPADQISNDMTKLVKV